jgi:phosphoenolpyruvate-protein kinase (PTS system EI component)
VGAKKAALDLTRLLLSERFGTIAPEVEQQMQNLSEEQLRNLATALLRFETAQAVSDWLKAHS